MRKNSALLRNICRNLSGDFRPLVQAAVSELKEGRGPGEIAGRLHFADQPTFHKFFKSHTGLTPMQYRRG